MIANGKRTGKRLCEAIPVENAVGTTEGISLYDIATSFGERNSLRERIFSFPYFQPVNRSTIRRLNGKLHRNKTKQIFHPVSELMPVIRH